MNRNNNWFRKAAKWAKKSLGLRRKQKIPEDVAGALAMNPLTTVVAVVIAAWAVADLVLLPRRRSLRVGLSPSAARCLRGAALLAFLANWVYLLVAGR